MNIVVSTLNAKFIHTCLALRYLKSYAAPEYDVQMAEYTIKDPTINVVTDLYQKNPDVIGFSCYIWNIEQTIPIIEMIKKIKPEIKIVLGGPEVTYDTEQWMNKIPDVDYVVIGEGEATFKNLLMAIENNEDVSDIGGIAYRNDGEIKINRPREKLDLKTIPTPYRFDEDAPELSKRVVYLETSRGCPFSCQFCLSSIEVGVRYFDRESIKKDIMYLMENGAKTIKFVDRTFNISRSYAMEMFEFLIKNHLPGTVFQFEITGDIMRPEVLEYLNEHAPVGLFRFEIGVQSTNDSTNELVQRKQNFSKLARTVRLVKEGGKIAQHLDLIAGLPEEDYNSFRQTFNDVFAFEPEELQLGFLKMLRGTGLRHRAADHDYIYMENSPYEILGNNILPFNDIVRIKQVEDVLEKYWNDHRMDYTIRYLVHHVFETPFDFFQAFGSYWEEKGWSRIGHQLEDLFRRLYEFLQATEVENLHVIQGIMKYDYLRNKKIKPRTSWWDNKEYKNNRDIAYEKIASNPAMLGSTFENLGLTERDLHKHTVIEFVPFNMDAFLSTETVELQETMIVIHYDAKKQTNQTFTLSMAQL